MCGICGYNWKDKELIKRMADSMKSRGPDNYGSFFSEKISLGHRRLSIIDLFDRGNQPMKSKNGNYIVYNGEIYNFPEIKEELVELGYSFDTKTDTEVLLKSYEHWGFKFIKKLIGMFAFCIYDKRLELLILGRDHMGIKPLYYYNNNDKFIFSSSISGILEHKIGHGINKSLIRDYVLYNNTDHTDETFFRGINKIPKGNLVFYQLKEKKLTLQKWHSIKFSNRYNDSYDKAVSEFRDLLKDSVKIRLISDVKVGTCLSGGIDSSSIACIINSFEDSNLETFSAVFPGFDRDESKYIDRVSEATGMTNNKTSPSVDDITNELENYVKTIEEPIPGINMFAQNRVFALANSRGTTVMLDGQGADELLAGYHYFYGFYFLGLLKRGRFGLLTNELYHLILNGDKKLPFLSFFFMILPLGLKERYFKNKSPISKKLYNDKSSKTFFFEKYYSSNNLHQSLQFHMEHKLEHLLKWEDRNSMSHSREARVPFVDIRLINFSSSLPESFLIRNGKTKAILRDSMHGLVPDSILKRTDKIGFKTPEGDWIRSDKIINLVNEYFFNSQPYCKDYIDIEKFRKLFEAHIKNERTHTREIWKIIILEIWLRSFKEHLL